jgi:hypothetical protein
VSRGLGYVQRRVLEELDKFHEQHGPRWVTLRSLVSVVGKDDERSSQESVRRAVRMLARRGLVELRSAGGVHPPVIVQRAGMPEPKQLDSDDEERISKILGGFCADSNSYLREIGSLRRVNLSFVPPAEKHRVFDLGSDTVYEAYYLFEY